MRPASSYHNGRESRASMAAQLQWKRASRQVQNGQAERQSGQAEEANGEIEAATKEEKRLKKLEKKARQLARDLAIAAGAPPGPDMPSISQAQGLVIFSELFCQRVCQDLDNGQGYCSNDLTQLSRADSQAGRQVLLEKAKHERVFMLAEGFCKSGVCHMQCVTNGSCMCHPATFGALLRY